jgi:hypothetical protein
METAISPANPIQSKHRIRILLNLRTSPLRDQVLMRLTQAPLSCELGEASDEWSVAVKLRDWLAALSGPDQTTVVLTSAEPNGPIPAHCERWLIEFQEILVIGISESGAELRAWSMGIHSRRMSIAPDDLCNALLRLSERTDYQRDQPSMN